jgi:nucleoside-diphosphate-sugar epimerase
MKSKLLIFGYGYVAKHLAAKLSKEDFLVLGTSRNSDQIHTLNSNIEIFNYNAKEMFSVISEVDSILISIPPNDKEVDQVLSDYKQLFLQAENIKWIGYLSSTGVYGDHDGRWVSEDSELLASGVTGNRRILAENIWMDLYDDYNLPIHIFRLSGIYGPKKNCITKFRKGKDFTIVKNNHYFSRIHVEDICRAISLSINNPTPGEIYNVSDSHPAPLHEVEKYGGSLISHKLREVPFEQCELSPLAKEFFINNRKVSSQKICKILRLEWKFPSYKEGLMSELL